MANNTAISERFRIQRTFPNYHCRSSLLLQIRHVFIQQVLSYYIDLSHTSNNVTEVTSLTICSERERVQEQVKQRTVSLWSYTNSQLPLYLNPLYRSGTNYQLVLMPIASMRYIKPWKSLYCRWNPSMRQQVC